MSKMKELEDMATWIADSIDDSIISNTEWAMDGTSFDKLEGDEYLRAQEAIAAKKLIGNKPFILVTSASHMKRALKFFKNEGLDPIPAPTNHLASIKNPNYTGFFSTGSLRKSNIVWHEMLGLLWQKIKGI